MQCAGPARPQLPPWFGNPPPARALLALPQQAFLANPDLGNQAVLALPYLSFLLELTLSLRKQDRNHHIWASGGNGRQAASLAGKDGTVAALQGVTVGGAGMVEQGWHSSLVRPGRPVGLEGVNPIPCGLCHSSVAGTYGRGSAGSSAQTQRTKGLTVPNSVHSLPQPFLCTAHPVFRFQATYLSNLRGVTPRPAGSFRPQLSFPPGLQRHPKRRSGAGGRPPPLAAPWRGAPGAAPSGLAPLTAPPWRLEMLPAEKL